jgi:hypothetical protein
MAKYIVTTTDKAARAIMQHLQRVKLTSFPKEDVTQISAVVTSSAACADSCGKLLDNIEESVCKGLTNTTVSAFSEYLTSLKTTESSKVSNYIKMMETTTTKFNELDVEDKWLPQKKASSYFQAQGNATVQLGAVAHYHNAGHKEVDRKPPTAGEAATRTNEYNWEEHWCGNCRNRGRWGKHPSANHDTWVTKIKERKVQCKERQRVKSDPSVKHFGEQTDVSGTDI